MFCAQCGKAVAASDRHCAQCGADLWSAGGVRLTSVTQPDQQLSDVFEGARVVPRHQAPPDDWFVGDGETSRIARRAIPEDLQPTALTTPVAPLRRGLTRPSVELSRTHRIILGIGGLVLLVMVLLMLINAMANKAVPVLPAPGNIGNGSLASDTTSPEPSSSSSSSPEPSGSSPSSATPSSPAPSATMPTSASPSPRASFPAGSKGCGGGVAVQGNTSCQFAQAVAAAIPADATATFTVKATSPVTRKDYELTCLAGSVTTCTGQKSITVHVIK